MLSRASRRATFAKARRQPSPSAKRFLVDDPGACFPLAALHDPAAPHQRRDGGAAAVVDGLVVRGLQQAGRDAGQAAGALVPLQPVEVPAGGGRQDAPKVRVVQEDRLLHERDHVAGVGHGEVRVLPRPLAQRVLQQARQALGLAVGQLERGVLGASPIADPAVG